MRERDGFEVRERRLFARKSGEFFALQCALDRAQAVRPLRVAGRCQVIETGGMRNEKSAHESEFSGVWSRWDMGGRLKSM